MTDKQTDLIPQALPKSNPDDRMKIWSDNILYFLFVRRHTKFGIKSLIFTL